MQVTTIINTLCGNSSYITIITTTIHDHDNHHTHVQFCNDFVALLLSEVMCVILRHQTLYAKFPKLQIVWLQEQILGQRNDSIATTKRGWVTKSDLS